MYFVYLFIYFLLPMTMQCFYLEFCHNYICSIKFHRFSSTVSSNKSIYTMRWKKMEIFSWTPIIINVAKLKKKKNILCAVGQWVHVLRSSLWGDILLTSMRYLNDHTASDSQIYSKTLNFTLSLVPKWRISGTNWKLQNHLTATSVS